MARRILPRPSSTGISSQGVNPPNSANGIPQPSEHRNPAPSLFNEQNLNTASNLSMGMRTGYHLHPSPIQQMQVIPPLVQRISHPSTESVPPHRSLPSISRITEAPLTNIGALRSPNDQPGFQQSFPTNAQPQLQTPLLQHNQITTEGPSNTPAQPNLPRHNITTPIRRNRTRGGSASGRRVSSRGRGTRSSLGRARRSTLGRPRNLLPILVRRTDLMPNQSSQPSSETQICTQLLSLQEMLRANFHQQHEIMRAVRDSLGDSNRNTNHLSLTNDTPSFSESFSIDSMTILSNSVCLTFQIFILAAFLGKAPLWYVFPNDEKEQELLQLCAGFFKINENGNEVSLDQEKVTVTEFLEGDTIYGKQGVKIWKNKGHIDSTGTRKDVTSLKHRLKRLRTRIHDEMTRTALRCFFQHVPEFQSLKLGIKYSFINSVSRTNSLKYCLDKKNVGIDPLTDGTWKTAYIKCSDLLVEHAKDRLKKVYRKLENMLSPNQLGALSTYFQNFYLQRYGRSISLLNFDYRRIIPAILEAFIATKVRCRLADIGTWEARAQGIHHFPFFEVSHCSSHFIPILTDLIKITQKQHTTPLAIKQGYGVKTERIKDEEFSWAKTEYERTICLTNETNIDASDVGLNLLASIVGDAESGEQENVLETNQHSMENNIQSGSSSSSTSSNSILSSLRMQYVSCIRDNIAGSDSS